MPENVAPKPTLDNFSSDEELLYTTVRIACSSETAHSTGTGFGFRFDLSEERATRMIVSNKHVVAGASTGTLVFTMANDRHEPLPKCTVAVTIRNFSDHWISHPLDVDLSVLPVEPILQYIEDTAGPVHFLHLTPEHIPSDQDRIQFRALEEVVMAGYPVGLYDEVFNFPILRRGSTSSHPGYPYNGRPEALYDIACFPGSSGSPIIKFIPNADGELLHGSRILLMGVAYAARVFNRKGEVVTTVLPTASEDYVKLQTFVNLAVAIDSRMLLVFQEFLSQATDDEWKNILSGFVDNLSFEYKYDREVLESSGFRPKNLNGSATP